MAQAVAVIVGRLKRHESARGEERGKEIEEILGVCQAVLIEIGAADKERGQEVKEVL